MKKKMMCIIATIMAFALFAPNVMAETVATIETKEYETLAKAIADVGTKSTTIKLEKDIVLDAKLDFSKDKTIILDLNGKTLSYESSVAGEAMITNNGSLTITDSTTSAKGKILFTYVGVADSEYGKGNYTISNSGTLVIENGIVENATAQMSHACYAIDNNAIGSESNLTINGGSVINTNNYAIRQIGSNYKNTITINDGTITGTRAVWIQLPDSTITSKPDVTLNVNGGKLIGTGEPDYKLAIYSYSYGNSLENVKINISGGILEGDLALSGGANKEISELVNITGGKITDVYSFAETENTRITISGGTFEYNPSEYLPTTEETSDAEIYEVYTPEGEQKYVVATEEEVEKGQYSEIVISGEDFVKGLEEAEKDENLSEESKTLLNEIKKVIEGKTIVSLEDIYYGSFIGDNYIVGSDESELEKAVKIFMEVPEGLKELEKGYTRKYTVIRIHWNKVEGKYEIDELEAKDNGDGTVSFETDKFSAYILTYSDVKTELPAKTGDINLLMLIGGIVVAIGGIIVSTKKRLANNI